jgi:hypothetical protein
MKDQYVIGDVSYHESDELDSQIYTELSDFKYYNYMFIFLSVIQLIVFNGFGISSLIVTVIGLLLGLYIYSFMKESAINVDFNYSETHSKLQYASKASIIYLFIVIIDIVILYFYGSEKVTMLFTLDNGFEKKFGFFACGMIVIKLLVSLGLVMWSHHLTKRTLGHSFSMKTF